MNRMKKQQKTQSYILQRMRRKTLKLSVTPKGQVLVKAPLRLSKAVIDAFVEKHADWIAEHVALAGQLQQKRQQSLQTVLFLGKEYQVYTWQEKEVCLKDGAIYLPQAADHEKQRRKVVQWYRAQAKAVLERRAAFWAEKMGCSYHRMRISSSRKRWGSCTSEKTLSFTWRLMTAPPKAVDYVIIHELAHLFYLNHSPEFWTMVAQYCPDYTTCKKLLEETSARLHSEGWDIS